MDSNFRFPVARRSNCHGRRNCCSRKRERICWGTEGSNPSPSSGESTTNCSGAGADSLAQRRGDDPRCAALCRSARLYRPVGGDRARATPDFFHTVFSRLARSEHPVRTKRALRTRRAVPARQRTDCRAISPRPARGDHANKKARPNGEGRLDGEMALDDLLTSLANAVGRAAADRLHQARRSVRPFYAPCPSGLSAWRTSPRLRVAANPGAPVEALPKNGRPWSRLWAGWPSRGSRPKRTHTQPCPRLVALGASVKDSPAQPPSRPLYAETTARPRAPHPRHRTRPLRSSTFALGLSPNRSKKSGLSNAT